MSTPTATINSTLILAHIERLARLHRPHPPTCMRRWNECGDRGMRIEGQRALVRLYERYCANRTTVEALREQLRLRVAAERQASMASMAREVVRCGKQVAA